MPSESALRDASRTGLGLIETFRREPVAGSLRLDRHLDRMARSAEALGLCFSREAALETVNDVSGPGALRVRMLLSPDGSFSLSSAPFSPTPPNAVWRLRIAQTALSSSNPLLRHKTTRRDVYERARAEFCAGEVDEVLLCNEAGAVCEGTMTNVFVRTADGRLKTPAASCGLLPGILRGELLATGKAVEALLTASDLREAKELFVGNSLRGLIRARLLRD
jgi:4-amino-4-deoxychorismate lyase